MEAGPDQGNLIYDGLGPDELRDGQILGVMGERGEKMGFTTWNIGTTTGKASEVVMALGPW